jgi:hypothetical protein
MYSLVVDDTQCGIYGPYGAVIECDIKVVQVAQSVCMGWLFHKYVLCVVYVMVLVISYTSILILITLMYVSFM